MENDVLKNKMAPWQEKGRWYHVTIKATGSAFSVIADKSDPFNFSINATNYLVVPLDVQILDWKVKLTGEVQASKLVRIPYDSFYVRYDTSATPVRIWLSDVDKFIGEYEIWFFAVEN